MGLRESAHGPVVVLVPDGPLIGGELNESLYARVRDLLTDNNSLVVVDLGQVPWINSSGVGTLMGCRSECLAHDGQLVLANANAGINDLLKSLKLDKVLVNWSTVKEAVETLGGRVG